MTKNPLAVLFQQVGLGAKSASKLSGVEECDIARLLTGQSADIEQYLRLAATIGARFRIAPAPPLSIWVDVAYLDAMCFDDDARAKFGLLPLPTTRRGLLEMVNRIDKELGGHSQTAVVKRLHASMIPTMQGLREWRSGTICRWRTDILNNLDDALDRPSWLATTWRNWIVCQLTDQWSEHDPMAFVRYGFKIEERDGGLAFTSSGQMPASGRKWILDSIAKVEWLTGKWRVEDDQPCS